MNGAAEIGDFASALNDPTKHTQVYEYVEALKGDESGWRKSIDTIITNRLGSAEEYFIMLQVVEDFVNTRYATWDATSTNTIRQLLSHCIQKVTTQNVPGYLMNKMAHVFSLVFATDFPVRWPHFMQDVFLCRSLDEAPFALFYLKTLLAIDSEVVDRDIQRAPEVFDRNIKIKDGMRDLCVSEMAQSWLHILGGSTNMAVQCTCLDVVALYIDWIDIELVANEKFVPALVERLGQGETAEAAERAVHALITKKMSAGRKLPLVAALSQLMHDNNLIDILPNSDADDFMRIGSLLSAIGLTLMDCSNRIVKEGGSAMHGEAALQQLRQELPTILRILGHSDTEASLCVIDFLKAYCTLILSNPTQDGTEKLEEVVRICIRRFEMGEELNIDGEGEDEADFHEYRKQLKQLIHPIVLKRPALLVQPLESAMAVVGVAAARQQESTGQLVYSLSELLPSGMHNAVDGWLERAARLPLRLLSIIKPSRSHSALTLLFFECASRYERLLNREPALVQGILPLFLADSGIGHPSAHVRARVVYLFSRFVKAHRVPLSSAVPEVIVRVAPLLATAEGRDSYLGVDEQACLFEATSTLIVHGSLSQDNKAQYMHELVSTLATKFESSLSRYEAARVSGDATGVEAASRGAAAIISFAIKLTKAFGLSTQEKSMAQCGCSQVFLELLQLFSSSLSMERIFLAEGCRQFGSRLLLCLAQEAFAVLPLLVDSLASVAVDFDSMQHLVILTKEIVSKHKRETLSHGLNVGAVLLVASRLCMESLPTSSEESRRSQMYLRRGYLQLQLAVLQYNVPIMEGASGESLLECNCRLALQSDPTTQKAAVSVLAHMSLLSPQWAERAARTVLSLPLAPHFHFKDAASSLVLHEVANCLQAASQAFPQGLPALIHNLFPQDFAQQVITALTSLKGKDLDRALTVLYTQMREP